MEGLDLGATLKGFNPGQKVFKRYTLKKILGRGGMGMMVAVGPGVPDQIERRRFTSARA